MVEKISTREAYGEALLHYGKQNEKIVALDADLSGSTKSAKFGKEFKNRFFNMGIAEQDMIATAAGLASSGKIVFASSFAMFITGRAYDQIRNSVAYAKFNVKVVGSHAGLMTGEDGASHQCIEDLSLMRGIPGMKVVCPADGPEVWKIVEKLIDYDGPAYMRLCRSGTPIIFDDTHTFEFGKGQILEDGTDVSLVGVGVCVSEALEAKKMLKEKGIDAAVINMPSIKPIDDNLIQKIAKQTGTIITCEDHNMYGGLGSAVAEVIAEKAPAKLGRCGLQDTFGESGKPAQLLNKYGLDAEGITKFTINILKKSE